MAGRFQSNKANPWGSPWATVVWETHPQMSRRLVDLQDCSSIAELPSPLGLPRS